VPHLFDPLPLGPISLPNRIAVSPMCQYSASDGTATDWHLQHLMQLALSRAGMVVVEATGVERSGRITHGCLGLYSDANEAALARVLDAARRVAAPGTCFAIQLAHAGRKASCQRPWEGGRPLGSGEDPWPTSAPSDVPFAEGGPVPVALDEKGLARVSGAFCQAADRAVRLGLTPSSYTWRTAICCMVRVTALQPPPRRAGGSARTACDSRSIDAGRAARAAYDRPGRESPARIGPTAGSRPTTR
jgi:2,4-dienoyl-CoA reductase-like NADH-dependent reductase (Old Yellow Enzyme family)